MLLSTVQYTIYNSVVQWARVGGGSGTASTNPTVFRTPRPTGADRASDGKASLQQISPTRNLCRTYQTRIVCVYRITGPQQRSQQWHDGSNSRSQDFTIQQPRRYGNAPQLVACLFAHVEPYHVLVMMMQTTTSVLCCGNTPNEVGKKGSSQRGRKDQY